jgi:hypothetical protein
MAVSFAKLLDALEIVDLREAENIVYLCRQTGQTFWRSDFPDFEELQDELPDDIEDDTKYIQVPNNTTSISASGWCSTSYASSCRTTMTMSATS